MKKDEIEDMKEFLGSDDKSLNKIYLKYLEVFKEEIDLKYDQVSPSVSKGELLSDATIALNDTFKEVEEKLKEAEEQARRFYRRLETGLSLKKVFNKHFARSVRVNRKENLPLSVEIRDGFKKTVSKTKNKSNYTDYERSCPVMSMDQEFNVLDDINITDSKSEETKQRIKDLIKLIEPDQNSKPYMDMYDRFVDNKTLDVIAKAPRNQGMSREGIRSRIERYCKRIIKKHHAIKDKERRV